MKPEELDRETLQHHIRRLEAYLDHLKRISRKKACEPLNINLFADRKKRSKK
jgi:hypothetical protein